MKVLVSAFKPFNNETINPSMDILDNLSLGNDIELYKVYLNVEYNNDSKILLNEIEKINPNVVILLGQAGGRSKVCLEYFALNMQSAKILDNNNVYISHNEIINDGIVAYKSNINLAKVLEIINDEYLTISYNAGTFVCNEIYYNALNYINENNLTSKCLFIHIPFIKEQVTNKTNVPYLEVDRSAKLIKDVINAIVKESV